MLLTITAAISFSIYFNVITQLHRRLKLNFKPFSCVPCLAAWSGVGFYFLPEYVSLIACVMFVPGVAAPLIEKFMNQWK